ncbi:hypothetical protein L1887_15155 [Cichorium endivia]|nr:hypothetical protein L1887_15155 [Cichorium endivia]
MISVANSEIPGIGKSPSAAVSWINTHVAAFKPATNITAIAVGGDVLSSTPTAAPFLVPAMSNLYKALLASNLNDVLLRLIINLRFGDLHGGGAKEKMTI